MPNQIQKREVKIIGYLTEDHRHRRATAGSETVTVNSLAAFTREVNSLRVCSYFMDYEIQGILIEPGTFDLDNRVTNLGPVDLASLYIQGKVDATVASGKLKFNLQPQLT